jgi:peptidoglycan/LPS O-acetylase OafA/YrhL
MSIGISISADDIALAPEARGRGEPGRLAQLDSVRGLAAFSVVVCHYLILLSPTPFGRWASSWLAFPPLCLLQTAYGSVILFFVLSGYVLALNLMGERRTSWSGFAVRRFCRIWPPYAATILTSCAIGHMVLAAHPVLPPVWQVNSWNQDAVAAGALARQLAMVSGHVDLDVPAWSLIPELAISLVFPLLLVLVRRVPAAALGMSLCLMLAMRLGPALCAQMPDVAAYVVYFLAGAWLALNRQRVTDLAAATSGWTQGLTAIVALVLLSVPRDNPGAPITAGLGAVLVIGLAAASPSAARLLSAKWCKFLGRISYSLYLTHAVVLMTLASLLGGILSVPLLLAVAAPVIGLVAWAGYQWLERPSIQLGRVLAARLSASPR